MFKHRLLTQALLLGGLIAPSTTTSAQDPAGKAEGNASDLVARMMKFDKNTDGKLTRAEITDARMVRLWTRADADKDGSVTKSELEAVDQKEQATTRDSFGGPGGPGGFGGMGAPGGPMGPPPKPGEVLPSMLRSRLKLTAEQQSQLDDLQRDVDARMDKILTDSQKVQIKQMSQRGPGGPGGRSGRGGPGGDNANGYQPPPPQ